MSRGLLPLGTLVLMLAVGAPATGQPAVADERATLDSIYALIGHREFEKARERWAPLARRVQESVQAASGRTLAPSAEAELRRRVGELIFVQGLIEARLGRRQDALELLRKADGYGFPPLDSPLMRLAADCLSELQEHALAAQAWREVVKAAPGDLEARLRLGASLHASGERAAAEAELREALRRDRGLAQAHYLLGAVLFEEKRMAEAEAELRQELVRDPRCSACLAMLAHLSYLAGDDAGCEALLARAVALDPSQLEANLVYGMLYNRTGRPERAVPHLLRVVEQAPAYAAARYQLALAYQRSGDAVRAREQREAYDRLLREQKAKSLGVRGAGE